MPAEAQHAHVHLAAAADHGHVCRHLAVDQRSASVDKYTLLCDRETPLQVKCPGGDFHFPYVIIGPE